MANSGVLRAGALVAFVLADGVAAHPRPTRSIDEVRLVGAVDTVAGPDAYAAGKRLLASDDVVGALAAFRQALTVDPASVDAMNGIGVSYDRLCRGDLARKYYRAALALDPRAPAVLNNLGYSLFLNGDFAAAVEPLRAAAAAGDSVASAAAAATLARLPEAVRATTVAAVAVDGAPARIELTSDGEQRLTFAAPATAGDVVALGDEADAVVVATAWSVADDAAMAVRVAAEQASEAAALRSAEPVSRMADAASDDSTAVGALPIPAMPPARPASLVTAALRGQRAAVASADRLVLASTTGDSTTLRRRQPGAAVMRTVVSGDDPRPPAALAFDSDDAELNNFATRVAAARAGAVPASDASGSIIARFRG